MTATHHRFNFLQPTTTHRIFLNCRPRVPHMFKWNSPEPGLKVPKSLVSSQHTWVTEPKTKADNNCLENFMFFSLLSISQYGQATKMNFPSNQNWTPHA